MSLEKYNLPNNQMINKMDQKIKKYFSIFNRQNKKLMFSVLLFFVISGLFFVFQPTSAQVGGLSCSWGDIACYTANFVFSILIKIVVLVVFALPLLISAFVAAIVALILGWIISPDFISLKFTQNAFVDIGLSITKNFANMGFILFLVVIALATILRIEEYKAKKTLPTLIIIALLVNFSPVFCGVIIDFTNIVMNFFLSKISGINGFVNIIMMSANSLWNSLWNSGLDLWANIGAAMQVIIGLAFNWFAAFILVLFCALFIMRYIMLWILVILSPIAFVSYILPITRRGGSLLNWKEWWKQLVSWSIIGITAGFFLYLGFEMIGLINADISNPAHTWGTISHPDINGWGLMNNILPYLIPLALLWIAYREAKRTSAMFAREIVEIPEKVTKAAVSTAVMAGLTVATAGVGAAAGAAGGAAKGAPGAISQLGGKLSKYGADHQQGIKGAVARTVGGGIERVGGWATAAKEKATDLGEAVTKKVGKAQGFIKEQAEEHKTTARVMGWMKKTASESLKATGLSTSLRENLGLSRTKEKQGRELDQDEIDGGEEKKTAKIRKKQNLTQEDIDSKTVKLPNGIVRPIMQDEFKQGYIENETEERQTVRRLTDKEIESEHLIETRKIGAKRGLIPNIKKGLGDAWKEVEKKYLVETETLAQERRREIISKIKKIIEDGGQPTQEDLNELDQYVNEYRKERLEGREIPSITNLEKWGRRKKKKNPEDEE
jgi:hypothetical protein